MIVTEKMMDEIFRHRLSRVLEKKKPIYRPRLKIHKLNGEKCLLGVNVNWGDAA